jgi:hypothetical protein
LNLFPLPAGAGEESDFGAGDDPSVDDDGEQGGARAWADQTLSGPIA